MTAATNGKNGYARIGVWASAISAGALIVAAFIWIGGIAQDVRSTKDVEIEQGERLGRIAAELQTLQIQVASEHASSCQQFAKVEGQVSSAQEILNEIHVTELRFEDIINQKVFSLAPSGKYHELTIEHTVLPCL